MMVIERNFINPKRLLFGMHVGLKNRLQRFVFALLMVVLMPLCLHGASRDTVDINSELRWLLAKKHTQPYDVTVAEAYSLLHRSSAANYMRGMAWCEFIIGEAYGLQERLDTAIVHARRSMRLFQAQPAEIEGRVRSLCLLGDVLLNREAPDSSIICAYEAINLLKSGPYDSLLLAYPYHALGQNHIVMGRFGQAFEYLQYALELFRLLQNRQNEADVLNSMGYMMVAQNMLFDALECHLRSLKIYTQIGDMEGALNQHNSIGHIYFRLGEYKDALKHLEHALSMKQRANNDNTSLLLLNLGTTFLRSGHLDSALMYARLAQAKASAEEEYSLQASTNMLKGEVLSALGQYDSASHYLARALTMFEQIGDINNIPMVLTKQAENSYRNGQFAKAEQLLGEATRIARSLKMPSSELNLRLLRENYELNLVRNDYRTALQSFVAYATLRDSLNRLTAASAIDFMRRYADQPMPTLQIVREGTNMRARAVIWSLAFVLLVALVIIALSYYKMVTTRSQCADMEQQIAQLNSHYSSVVEQHSELSEQRNLVMMQRDKIINILSDLGDSIAYATKIQQVMLPPDNQFRALFEDYFVFNRPRDSVSGDFYWIGITNTGHTVFVVADCTGHGIPGGFMSMVGMALIIEVVARNECDTPATALDMLRSNIIHAFKQNDNSYDNTDGMDMAMCVYRPEEQNLYFAGANQSIFVATSNPLETTDRIRKSAANLYEIKPDRMPISIADNMEPFSDVVIPMAPNDIVYLSSDGYKDQFGGAKSRKMGSPAFRALLNRIKGLTFEEQKIALQDALADWQGECAQTDDILVMGIKPVLKKSRKA